MRPFWGRPKNRTLADLVVFVDAGVVPPRLAGLRAELGRMELRYAALRLLNWLECQADPTTASTALEKREIMIDTRYQWCQNLLRLFEEFEELGRFFAIRDGELVWSESTPFEEQLALARQASRRKTRG